MGKALSKQNNTGNPEVSKFEMVIANTEGIKETLKVSIGNDVVDYVETSRVFGMETLKTANQKKAGTNVGTGTKITGEKTTKGRVISLTSTKNGISSPMLLSIGSGNQLTMVCQDDAASGWKLHELTKHEAFKRLYNAEMVITAIGATNNAMTNADDLGEENAGNPSLATKPLSIGKLVTIAVAIKAKEEDKGSHLFIAYDINTETTDWKDIKWIDYGKRNDLHVDITGILILNKDNEWITVLSGLTGEEDKKAKKYLINSATNITSLDDAVTFDPVIDLEKIKYMEVGFTEANGAGLFELGKQNSKDKLIFRAFPSDFNDKEAPHPTASVINCPAAVKVIRAGKNTDTGTNLFFGGKGINMIKGENLDQQNNAEIINLYSEAELMDVKDIIVNETESETIIYALTGKNDLYMLQHLNNEPGKKKIINLKSGVREIAVAKRDGLLTSSIIVIGTDNKAVFLKRTEAEGIWSEEPLMIDDEKGKIKKPAYSITLRILNTDGVVVPQKKVAIKCSLMSNIVVNGKTVFVGPDRIFEAETNLSGTITIYDKARSYAPGFYRFCIEGADEAIDVNPAEKLSDKLKNVSGGDLIKASSDGDSGTSDFVIPQNLKVNDTEEKRTLNEFDSIAGSLNRIANSGKESNIGLPGIWKVPVQTGFNNNLTVNGEVESGYLWAVQSVKNGFKPLSITDANKIFNIHNMLTPAELKESPGDFFTSFRNTISEGWAIAVKVVKAVGNAIASAAEWTFNLVCKVGSIIKEFVVETVQQIGDVLKTVFNAIKVAADKVIGWVKMILDWEDMVLVRDLFSKYFVDGIGALKTTLVNYKKPVEEFIDNLIISLDSANSIPPQSEQKEKKAESDFNTNSKDNKDSDSVMGNSIVATIFDEINKAMENLIEIKDENPISLLVSGITDFVVATASEAFEVLMNIVGEVSNKLKTVGNNFSLKSLFEDPLTYISKLFKDVLFDSIGISLIKGILGAAKILLSKTIDLAGSILNSISAASKLTVGFPIIDKIFAFFGSKIKIEFNFMNALLLIVAIPTTILYKIIYNKPPIKKLDVYVQLSNDGNLSLTDAGQKQTSVFSKLASLASPIFNFIIAIFTAKDALSSAKDGIPKPGEPTCWDKIKSFLKWEQIKNLGKSIAAKGKEFYNKFEYFIKPLLEMCIIIFEFIGLITWVGEKGSVPMFKFLFFLCGFLAFMGVLIEFFVEQLFGRIFQFIYHLARFIFIIYDYSKSDYQLLKNQDSVFSRLCHFIKMLISNGAKLLGIGAKIYPEPTFKTKFAFLNLGLSIGVLIPAIIYEISTK